MKWESGDLKVGIVVLLALALFVGGLVWLTTGATDRGIAIYTRYDAIDGLAEQAPVQLGGFTIGRVDDIAPRVGENGAVVFDVRLKIDWTPEAGRALPVPVGTRARLVPPPVTGTGFLAGYVQLEPPAQRGLAPLQPGDTLPGVRSVAMVEQVQEFVTSLTHDWTRTLAAVNTLVDSLTRTAAAANRLAGTTQDLLPRVSSSLEQRLATADSLMLELRAITPHAVASMDSVQAIISDTRRLVASVDRSLEARDPQIGRVLANLDTTTAVLNHFVREVTRRPGRLVSGVQPPLRLDPVRAALRREQEQRERCAGKAPCTAAADSLAREP